MLVSRRDKPASSMKTALTPSARWVAAGLRAPRKPSGQKVPTGTDYFFETRQRLAARVDSAFNSQKEITPWLS